eukprot:scaffold19972_cov128-Isochrysis_galbana.AAC.7
MRSPLRRERSSQTIALHVRGRHLKPFHGSLLHPGPRLHGSLLHPGPRLHGSLLHPGPRLHGSLLHPGTQFQGSFSIPPGPSCSEPFTHLHLWRVAHQRPARLIAASHESRPCLWRRQRDRLGRLGRPRRCRRRHCRLGLRRPAAECGSELLLGGCHRARGAGREGRHHLLSIAGAEIGASGELGAEAQADRREPATAGVLKGFKGGQRRRGSGCGTRAPRFKCRVAMPPPPPLNPVPGPHQTPPAPPQPIVARSPLPPLPAEQPPPPAQRPCPFAPARCALVHPAPPAAVPPPRPPPRPHVRPPPPPLAPPLPPVRYPARQPPPRAQALVARALSQPPRPAATPTPPATPKARTPGRHRRRPGSRLHGRRRQRRHVAPLAFRSRW